MYYGMENRGFRIKVGLDFLSHNQTPEQTAKMYGITPDEVSRCCREARPVHDRLVSTRGICYFASLDMRNKPDNLFSLFCIGSSKLA